jgi:hypothetical protein
VTIDWRMSAALENVPRGGHDVAEVTSLAGAVRAWGEMDAEHRAQAVLTTDHPVQIDDSDAAVQCFSGDAIQALADRLRHDQDGAA